MEDKGGGLPVHFFRPAWKLPGIMKCQVTHGIPLSTQVGVISWGVVDVCKGALRRQRQTPSYARDFHVNLFEVLPWLKEKLKDEDLGFL